MRSYNPIMCALITLAGGVSPLVLAAPQSNTLEAPIEADAAGNAKPSCQAYAQYVTRAEAVLHETEPCDTISPELGGLRGELAAHGIGVYGSFSPNYRYDVLGHNQSTQLYNGQDPTWRQSSSLGMTYDLTRLGWGGKAQFTAAVAWESGDYKSSNPNFLTMSIFAINQRFFDDRLEVQYGYYPLIRQYYGMVLGGNSSAAALGPGSVIPVELGLSLFSPSPALTVAVWDKSKTWYNRASVARSASPNFFQYDLDQNPTGFKLKVDGSNPLVVDELGYKVESAPGQKSTWVRVGGIYNTSHFTDYRNGGEAEDNFGGYAAATLQLTQPDGASPRGLYGDVKVDYAPPDRNLYTRDFQVTAFYIGPFDSRPRDMASVGYTKSYFSKYVHDLVESSGTDAERTSAALSLSYAARMARGLYWVNGLTYQQGPSFSPAQPNALLFQTGLNFAF
ncbi:carbohydrate porin [Pseudomonas putida]